MKAPEVIACYAVLLGSNGDQVAAQQKFLEIPDRQRLRYSDVDYLKNVISWPPSMVDGVTKIAEAVGDYKRKLE